MTTELRATAAKRHHGNRDSEPGAARDGCRSPFLLELAAAVLIAGALSAGVQFIVARLPIPHPSNLGRALLALGAAVVICALFVLHRSRSGGYPRGVSSVGTWASLSTLTTIGLALPLNGTLHYLGGTSIDQEFRLQFMTRLANSPALADMNFADLPTYYPAAWFWLGGRAADLLGLPAWEVYKPYSILTMAIAAAVSYTVWHRILPSSTAAAVSTTTALIGLQVGATEPYSWLPAALLPPVAVIAWRALAQSGGVRPAALIGVGVYLGACVATYTLLGAVAGLLVVVLAAVALAGRLAPLSSTVHRLLVIAVAALPLVALQWPVYLLTWWNAGLPSAAATRFLPMGSAQFPTPIFEPTPLGVLSAAGLLWMVVAFRHSAVAQALAALTAVVYLWFGLSTLAVLFGQTLLAFRLVPVIQTVLAVAGVLGVLAGVHRLRENTDARAAASAATVAALFAALLGVSLAQSLPADDRAYTDYYPTGASPTGSRDLTRDEYWSPFLVATINRLTGRPPDEVVLLTSYGRMLASTPYRSFLSSTAHYASPLADYDGRRAVVEQWAAATDATQLQTLLDSSPYRSPSVFVLRTTTDGLQLPMSKDVFPAEPNIAPYEVAFDPGAFAGAGFRSEVVGPFTVVVRP